MLAFIIICMIISPLMSIPILCVGLYYNRNSLSRGYAVPLALLYGMIGYNLRPIGEMDLVRYYTQLDKIAGQKLSYIFSIEKQGMYTKDLLFYFVSRTGNNDILGFIVGFCCYLIIFYVFIDVVQRYRDSSKHNCNIHIFMIGFVMVSIVSPMSLISNVRCVFAYILICFAVYREWVQKKRNIFTYLLYIIPIGLHVSAVVILVIRIVTPFLKKFTKLFICIPLLLPVLIEYVYEKTKTMSGSGLFGYISNAVAKAYYYLNWTEGGWADQIENSTSNIVIRIYGTFFLMLMIIFYFVNKKNEKDPANVKMHDYLFLISLVALGTLSIKTGAFWRFEAIAVFFSPFILMPIAMQGEKKYRYLLIILYLSAFMMNLFNIIRFIRNIIMHDFFVGCFYTSNIKIVWELIRGITVIWRE